MSILSIISKIFKRPNKHVPFDEIPRYPPFQVGLPVVNGERIMQTQHDLIRRIKRSLNLTPAEYSELIEPVIKNYAEFVHLLPASEANHHRGAGGLFAHGLEVAVSAIELAEDYKPYDSPLQFYAGGVKGKKDLVWRVAVCLGGMMHDLGKPATDMSVTNRDGNMRWNPYESSLYQWAIDNNIDRYFIHWNKNRHGKHDEVTSSIVPEIFGRKTISFLNSADNAIYPDLMAALTKSESDTDINNIIRKSDQRSCSNDRQVNNFDAAIHGTAVPVETHLKDAIRRLTHSGQWKINRKGSRVWVFKEGVFIVWQAAAKEIVELLRRDQIPGIPVDPTTLAEILINRGVAVNNVLEDGEYTTWTVAPDELTSDSGKIIELKMLKLSSKRIIFEDHNEPPAVSGYINGERSDPNAPAIEEDIVEQTMIDDEEGSQAYQTNTNEDNRAGLDEELASSIEGFDLASTEKAEPPSEVSQQNVNEDDNDRSSLEVLLKDNLDTRTIINSWLSGQDQDAVFLEQNNYYLAYPGSIIGKPSDTIKSLSMSGLILSVEDKPMVFTHSFNGKRGLLFNDSIQKILRSSPKLQNVDLTGADNLQSSSDLPTKNKSVNNSKIPTHDAKQNDSEGVTKKTSVEDFFSAPPPAKKDYSVKEDEGLNMDKSNPETNEETPNINTGKSFIAVFNAFYDLMANKKGIEKGEQGMPVVIFTDLYDFMKKNKVDQEGVFDAVKMSGSVRVGDKIRLRKIETLFFDETGEHFNDELESLQKKEEEDNVF